VAAAAKQIIKTASAQPAAFINLELRKIPRLWAAPWNDFQYQLFGIPLALQESFHQLLLALSILGMLLLLSKPGSLAKNTAAISLLLSLFGVHALYMGFEPISRYAMTLAPAMVMLSGYTIALLWSRANPRALTMSIIALALPIFALTYVHQVVAWCALTATDKTIFWIASLAYLLILVGSFACLQIALSRAGISGGRLTFSLAAVYVLVGTIVTACLTGDPEMSEWKTTLSSPDQSVRQEISLPARAEVSSPASAYVLMDLDLGQCPAPIDLTINGSKITSLPRPLWQIRPSLTFLSELALEEKAMGVSKYSYRQWWLVPVSSALLKFGANNTIVLSGNSEKPVTIFGDYRDAGELSSRLPSLSWASWIKAFCTYDHHDARVYQRQSVAAAHSSYQDGHGFSDANIDLSSDPGRQFGQYRLRIAVFKGGAATPAVSAPARITLDTTPFVVSVPGERLVSGGDPAGMQVIQSADIGRVSRLQNSGLPISSGISGHPISADYPTKGVSAPSSLQPTAFDFRCQLASKAQHGTAYIGVKFEGQEEDGSAKSWTSLWQPACIQTGTNWSTFCLSDFIPAEVAALKNLKASVTVCPFHPELLFLHHKQAVKRKLLIRNISLTVRTEEGQLPAAAPIDFAVF
jgi:hypothetical protein